MGALVAYEIALLLEERGQRPARFFVSGCRGAAVPDERPTLHTRDDETLLAELAAMGGTDTDLLSHPEFRQLVLPALRADFQAVETYTCPDGFPLHTPVTALIGDADPRVRPATADAWSELTLDSYELRVFRGDHFFLMAPGTFGEVVELLRDRLTGARPTPAPIRQHEVRPA
jgi:surfactin synthase thioesterase subunit